MTKKYYSVRTGKNKNFSSFDINILKKLFLDLYNELETDGYFQEYFGYSCVDGEDGHVCGAFGYNIEDRIYRVLRKEHMWPIKTSIENYSEDDLFDMIEFLYDYISKPVKRPNNTDYHSYCNCGYHYSKFDKHSGQIYFIEKINEFLREYENSFELNEDGQIVITEENGLGNIHLAKLPNNTPDNIKNKIEIATNKYLMSRSNMEERRIAIRELADILEELKKDITKYLGNKDNDTIFNIANSFAIRHSNDKQKINYDRDIWYSWMYYFYLSTIYAILKIRERKTLK